MNTCWRSPLLYPPEKLVDYMIWNEEESRQEIGCMQRNGVWISYMSIDPAVTSYHEMLDDPQGV